MDAERINPQRDQRIEEVENEETWKEYILGEFIRYWYILGCFAIDIFSSLEIINHQEWALRFAFVAIVLVTLLVFEIWGYLKLWGRDGIWNFEEEDQR